MGVCENFSINKNINNNGTAVPLKDQKKGNCLDFKSQDNLTSNNDKNIQTKEEMEFPSNDTIDISSEQSEKIIKQSQKYICKILNGESKGTGFLCKIPFPDKNNCLPVLMTNDHVINEEELLNNKILKITFNDDKIEKKINITSERIIYSLKKINEDYDLIIIEIYPEEDKIFHFLEMDYIDITQNNPKEAIYILQYPGGEKCSISYGKILAVKDFNIRHDCSTNKGSSGGPILLLKNYKLIGIHRGFSEVVKCNEGIYLKKLVEIFNSNFSTKNKKTKNKYINCIICKYHIKSEDEFNLLYDYTDVIEDSNKVLNQLNIESKKKKKFF